MRAALSVVLGLAVALVVAAHVSAADKEVTLKGTILCAKCELKEAKKCTTAIVVKEDGKDVTYYFNDKGAKESTFDEAAQKKALKESYEWNTTEATVRGDGTISVKINGIPVSTAKTDLTSGPIGFQSEAKGTRIATRSKWT